MIHYSRIWEHNETGIWKMDFSRPNESVSFPIIKLHVSTSLRLIHFNLIKIYLGIVVGLCFIHCVGILNDVETRREVTRIKFEIEANDVATSFGDFAKLWTFYCVLSFQAQRSPTSLINEIFSQFLQSLQGFITTRRKLTSLSHLWPQSSLIWSNICLAMFTKVIDRFCHVVGAVSERCTATATEK